jgi:hypothetical protein
MHETHDVWTPQNRAHKKPPPAATPYWNLVARPRSKHEKRMRNLDSFGCWQCMLCPCRVRNTFLITFETAPFPCVCPVLVNQRKCTKVQNVKTMRGPNCESDHYIVKTVGKQKLITNTSNSVQEENWNKANLQDKKQT